MRDIVKTNLYADEVPAASLFDTLARDIRKRGFSIQPNATPEALTASLVAHARSIEESHFDRAGIGRKTGRQNNPFVRRDEICWITGESAAERAWLEWTAALQTQLNQTLLLGLFSFESHFAHYAPGSFYRRHYDNFRGDANRILSIVLYLNSGWSPNDGGELVLYQRDSDQVGTRVTPAAGTLVAFLSEEFPHEVLATHRDRYSIAGWYRLNGSYRNQIDPPA